jgi:hypothetical protein
VLCVVSSSLLAQVLSPWGIWAGSLGLEKNLEIFESAMEESAERRKHRRFRVQDGNFAALSPWFCILGQIVDISRSGLAFRYVARSAGPHKCANLKILKTDGSFSCDRIPFKTIWDCSTPRESSLGSLALRHCGVQFGKLRDDQKFDLKYFIENHTTDKAES